MRRRHFLQLFASVPAVVMAQRAIPAVLGAPEYIAAGDNDLVVELLDESGQVIGAGRVRKFTGGWYEVVFKAEEIRGVPRDARVRWLGHTVRQDKPWSALMMPPFYLRRGDTLTVQGGVTIS